METREKQNLLTMIIIVAFLALFPFIISQKLSCFIIGCLHDTGYTWPYIFTIFIPFVGWIILLVLLCKPTKVESPFNNS